MGAVQHAEQLSQSLATIPSALIVTECMVANDWLSDS